MGEDELLKANYAPALYESAARLDKLLAAHGWDETSACLPIPFPTLGRKKKRAKELDAQAEMDAADRAERIKSIRSRCKKQLEKLSALFQENSRELGEELALARPVVQALMDLTTDFLADYAREKRRRGLVDFSDLEHLTVKLLSLIHICIRPSKKRKRREAYRPEVPELFPGKAPGHFLHSVSFFAGESVVK